jgi:hypothetical protein
MAYGNFREVFSLKAGADLSALQYHAIALDDGARAVNGAEAGGILQNKPKSGEGATLAFSGISKFRAGGSITIGGRITVDSNSTCIAAAATAFTVGRALATVTSGSIGSGMFNFANPHRVDSSNGV